MSGRIAAVDSIRGVALAGIVVGNVMWFSGYAVASDAARDALGTGSIDRAVAFATHWLVDGKFYALFSLLFGVGFSMLVASAEAQRLRVSSVVGRRLVALAVIGFAHALLLWFGDIISLYAVAAVPLLFVRRWPTRQLLGLASISLVAPLVVSVGQWLLYGGASSSSVVAESGHGPAALLGAFSGGDYLQSLRANAAFWSERWVLALYSSRLVRIFGFFVLGVAAARSLPAANVRPPSWLWPLAIVSNLALALLSDVPTRPPSVMGLLHDTAYAVALPSGCLLYALLLWRWASRGGAVARAFAAAGRLSLTHYLGQSLVMAIVFYGWGFGYWGRVGAADAVALALGLVAVQVWLSRAWLRHFGQGPMERLLRAATRGYRPSATFR